MKPTGKEFLEQRRKAITLMGMSGVGKTHFAGRLNKWGWDSYSCDYEIGTKHLKLPVMPNDLTKLSEYIGKLGNPEKGGLTLAEFKRRQKSYYRAECEAVDAAGALLVTTTKNFVNDSTGSLCEIEDEKIISRLGRETLMIYIKADDAHKEKLIERAKIHPKPLFFPPDKFDKWLATYMDENYFSETDEIIPDNFAKWVFPKLVESRLPKYRKIADQYGVTIPVAEWNKIGSEQEFLDVVAGALG